jgi:hypothetical protein
MTETYVTNNESAYKSRDKTALCSNDEIRHGVGKNSTGVDSHFLKSIHEE